MKKGFVRICVALWAFLPVPVVCSQLQPEMAVAFEGFDFTFPPSLRGVDLYKLIGINKTEYQEQQRAARARAEQQKLQPALARLPFFKDINEKIDQAKRENDAEAEKRLRAERDRMLVQKQYEDSDFSRWAKEKITSACKLTRKKIRSDIEELEREIARYPTGGRMRIDQDLRNKKKQLEQTAHGCSFLLDPKYRAQYDEKVFRPGASKAEIDASYEQVKSAVERNMLLGPDNKVLLNDVLGDILSNVHIPGGAATLFNQNLEISDLRVLPKPQGEDIKYYVGFAGNTIVNGVTLQVKVYVIWDIYNTRRWSISIATPDQYRLTNLFPSLRALNWMVFPQARFVLANFSGTDDEGFSFSRGLNFLGQWDIFSGPLAFFKKLQEAAPKLKGMVFETEPVQVAGKINPKNVLRSEFSAKVPVYFGIDFTQISKLPTKFTNVINRLTTDALQLSVRPLQRSIADEEPALIQKRDDARRALQEETRLKVTGRAAEQQARLEALQKEYEKAQRRLEIVQSAKKEAEKKEAQKPKAESFSVHGSMKEHAPAAIDIIRQASRAGFIVEATTGAILTLGTQQDPITFALSGLVSPPSMKYPQGYISLSGQLKNMVEFGWLAIGNAAVVLDFDLAALDVLILFGIPVSGFFVNGQLALGKPGEARASLKVGGGVSITSTAPIDNVVFEVDAENIRPTDFVRYLGYQLMKSKYAQKAVGGLSAKGAQLLQKALPKGASVPGLKLPDLVFEKVWGYASLGDATIGKQTYRAGLGLQVEMSLFDKKAGLRIFVADQEKGFSLEGFGYGPPLNLTIKGRELFKIYSSQDPKKGPYIKWDFNPQQLFETVTPESSLTRETVQAGFEAAKSDVLKGGAMSLDGVLEIPMLSLKQIVRFSWAGYTIDAQFESEVAGFSVLFGVTMNTKEGVETHYEKVISDMRANLALKDQKDARAIAAERLLRNAEMEQSELGKNYIAQAEKLVADMPDMVAKPTLAQRARAAKTQAQQAFTVKEDLPQEPVAFVEFLQQKDFSQQQLQRLKSLIPAAFSVEDRERIISTIDEQLMPYAPTQAEQIKEKAVRGVQAVREQAKKAKEGVRQIRSRVASDQEQQAQQIAMIAAWIARLERDAQEKSVKLSEKPQYNQLLALYQKARASNNFQAQSTMIELLHALVDQVREVPEPDEVVVPEKKYPFYTEKTEVVDPRAKWKGLMVTFGFKNIAELSKRISEQLVPYLQRQKEVYLRQIEAINAKVERWEKGTIDPTTERAEIIAREKKITEIKEKCRKFPAYRQVKCRPIIAKEQLALQKDKAILKLFVESKASKDLKKVAAIGYRKAQAGKRLKAITEKTLSMITSLAEKIAKGIDVIKLKDVLGRYGFNDIVSLKLPRLVRLIGEINIMEMSIPIELHNLQFDFKNPIQSTKEIAGAIMGIIKNAGKQQVAEKVPALAGVVDKLVD